MVLKWKFDKRLPGTGLQLITYLSRVAWISGARLNCIETSPAVLISVTLRFGDLHGTDTVEGGKHAYFMALRLGRAVIECISSNLQPYRMEIQLINISTMNHGTDRVFTKHQNVKSPPGQCLRVFPRFVQLLGFESITWGESLDNKKEANSLVS